MWRWGKQHHLLLTILLLVAALICYGLGAHQSSVLLVMVGCCLEMAFWSRLVLRR